MSIKSRKKSVAGDTTPVGRMSKVVQQWFLSEPLLFGAWTTHRAVANPHLMSIRVGQGNIEFNPEFIRSLDEQTLQSVMECEALRILLKHPYERRKPIRECALEASNLAIRECVKINLPIPTAQAKFATDVHDRKCFEYYYNLLVGAKSERRNARLNEPGLEDWFSESDSRNGGSDCKETAPADDSNESRCCSACGNKSCQGDCRAAGSAAQPMGNGRAATVRQYCDSSLIAIQNTQLWDYDQFVCEQINDLITDIESSDSWGTIAGNGRELILATRRPKLDYRSVLRSFRASVLSTTRCLTRMKPSRRYGFQYMGSRRDFTTHLLFAVDVSGSVSSEDVRNAFSIVNRLFKYGVASIDVIWFDTAVRNEKPLTLKRARYLLTVEGRGGTAFQPLMDYLDDHRQYDGLIVFTDGVAPLPRRPKKNRKTRVVWLFNHQRNWEELHLGLQLPGMTSAYVMPD